MARKLLNGGDLLITLVRSSFFILVTIISGFAVLVGRIGIIKSFSEFPSKLLFIVISPEEAHDIRDDVMEALQKGASVAIKEYGTEGYPKRQSMRHIQNQAEESIPANRQLFEAGEFGLSLLLTAVAILTAFFGIGGMVSVVLAITTGLLILSVAIRVTLINRFAYSEIPSASFSELIPVWYWNEKVLGEAPALLYILTFKFAKQTYEPFYNLCLTALARSAVKSVQNPDVRMGRLFWQEIRSPFIQMAKEVYHGEDTREHASTAET